MQVITPKQMKKTHITIPSGAIEALNDLMMDAVDDNTSQFTIDLESLISAIKTRCECERMRVKIVLLPALIDRATKAGWNVELVKTQPDHYLQFSERVYQGVFDLEDSHE